MNRLKKVVAFMLIFAMVSSLFTSVGFAGVGKWESVAGGDVLIKDTVTKIADNVYEHEVVTNNAAGNDQKIDYLTEISPSDSLKIVAGYGENSAEKWSLTTTSKQAESYMKDNPGTTVVSAINADFFNMGTGEPLGALVMEGEVKHDANGRYYFGVTKDGKPVIRNTADLSDLQSAVGGDALLIDNGVIMTENTAYGALDYSRTAIGIKADGTIVTFVTYGNRAPVSCGRTYLEIAEMLKGAGCVYALALDGGGSATLLSRPEGTTGLQLRNHPVDGAEREVSSSLLIVSTKEQTGVFSHAQLTPNNEVYTPGSTVAFAANGVDTAGIAMELPENVSWALAEESKTLGAIDEATGVFTAGTETGVVTVNLLQDGKVIGSTSVEIVVPDHIYFATEEVSLGFEEESDLGIVVRSKGRDVNYKDGDILWTIEDAAAGAFTGNIFKSSDGNSVTTTATAVSAYDAAVSGKITVIVGKLPTVIWDFEDVTTAEGTVIPAENYYVNGYKTVDATGAEVEQAGILTTSNYGRGGKQSIEIVNLNDEEPVRFGGNSLKLNYDFTQCGEVTEGACIGTTAGMSVPGVPTGIGVWVYAPEGVGLDWEKDETGATTQAGFWLRGYVKDGSGGNVPYDFTLEPKVCEERPGTTPGIYWEGWKYLEADLTKLQAPFAIQPGMTFRLMFVHGTKMGTRSANSIYFDNLQFVYGTNVDDIDNPVIDSITVNGTELTEDSVINTNVLNIDSIFHDVQNRYTSGIDDKTIRMYIDGVNVVDNDRYEYAYADSIAHLYNLKLKDGSHSVTVTIRDGFGNETSETRNFVVAAEAQEVTSVGVVPAGEAILGGTIDLQIRASDNTVVENTTSFKLGNQFKEYEVIYSDNYNGETSYSKLTKNITVKATRKADAAAEDNQVIATLRVKIPSTLLESDAFTYTVKSGKFETAGGQYDTYSTKEQALPLVAGYNLSVDPIIIGGEAGVIQVKDTEGNPTKDVTVYLAADDSVVGVTDENGQVVTEQFNTAAGEYIVYAKDEKGMLSFRYKFYAYNPQGDLAGAAHNIRFNVTDDAATKKNITWMSNPLAEGKQVLQYAVSGTDAWTTVEAVSGQNEFGYNGFNAVDVNAVLLEGLTPATKYDYMVGTEGAMSDVKTFSTEPANRKDSKFFILGDIQDPNKDNLATIVDKLNDEDYNFGIQIGDAIDQANDYADWAALGDIVGEKMLADTDMLSVMGNHEYYGDSDASISSAIYNNPVTEAGSYYSVENGNVYMAVINFCDNTTQIKTAAEWLKADAAKSDATWKIVLTHQPAYFTNSVGGNDPVYEYLPDACEAAGVDVVFSGHDHSFGRTNPLIDDQINKEDGIVYYVTGAIGSKRYPVSTQDKFDYTTIFNYLSEGFSASYLTVESNMDEMTVKMYELGNEDPVNVYTVESACKKNGHSYVYDVEEDLISCEICKEKAAEDFTGDVEDADGNEYYFLAGQMKTGWVTVGQDVRYYGVDGIREKVTVEEGVHTCIIDTVYTYTSESGEVKTVKINDAGGHDYVETDGKYICSVCGWQRVRMDECDVSLSYSKVTYTGEKKWLVTSLTNPVTGEKLVGNGTHPDYKRTYKNNLEVGTASITFTARKYGYYVNINDWRGNYEGSVTRYFDICPAAPAKAKVIYNGNKATLSWDEAKGAEKYVIYRSTNGGDTYKEIGTTTNCEYVVRNLDAEKNYIFRIGSRAAGLDENQEVKNYDSVSRKKATDMTLKAEVSYSSNGKPVVKWDGREDAVYNVYRATSKDGTYKKMFTTSNSKYTNTSAKAGKTYYYYVEMELNGNTSTSNICSATARCEKPVVTTWNLNSGKPKLGWEKVDGAVRYDIYRSTTGKSGSFKKVFSTTNNSYTNTAAEVGETYYYKVAAVEEKTLVRTYSAVVKESCGPAKVKVDIGSRIEDRKPYLSWNSVEGAVKYEIYRSTSGESGTFKKQFTTTKLTYINTSVTKGKTYYYKVRAVTESGVKGKFSTVVSVFYTGI